MSHPQKDPTQAQKLPTAPMPQKNAVQAPVGGAAQHEEALLDDALESTFPASDPVAETAVNLSPEQQALRDLEDEIAEHEEFLLDDALEMTFPASDPIAVPDMETVVKAVTQLQ